MKHVLFLLLLSSALAWLGLRGIQRANALDGHGEGHRLAGVFLLFMAFWGVVLAALRGFA